MELEGLPECNEEMAYLLGNGWWDIARPVETAEDLMDLLQPLLACKSWDWHGTAAAKALMHWAGLLSIISLAEGVNVGTFPESMGKLECWQEQGSDYMCYVPMA